MKIIGIIGSLRKDSVHRLLFNHYQTLCAPHFALEEGAIAPLPLYNGEDDTELNHKVLAQTISAADGVIFFSPEYNYSISGVLKNAIDWLSRAKPQPLAGKPVTIIGASPGNVGAARSQYHLRQVGVFMDMRFMNKPEMMIPRVFEKLQDGRLTDQTTLDMLEKHAKAFKGFVEGF